MNIKKHKIKKIISIIIIAILFATIVSSRPYKNVLVEVIIFSEGGVFVGSSVYRFIIQNDGTFINYTGIAIHTNVARPNTIMLPLIRRRMRINISDEDLRNIIQLIEYASKNYEASQSWVFGLWEIAVLYNGNVYERHIIEIDKIINELIRLSPMPRWNDPRISTNL